MVNNLDIVVTAGDKRSSINSNTQSSLFIKVRDEDNESMLGNNAPLNERIATSTVAEEDPAEVDLGWSPSGVTWRDVLYFCGPGWLVSIAYVDPGNYQADIQAGATTRYILLYAVWWSSIYSIYVQVLCVRLGYRTRMSLSEVQSHEYKLTGQRWKIYVAWLIAEFSVMITDLPEVIGFAIALKLFFGLTYWIGVLLSLITTMIFLALQRFGIQKLEIIICLLVGLMSIALFVEMGLIGVAKKELIVGWVYGFVDIEPNQLFTIVGIIGAVCMPHNLYLHSGTCQERAIDRSKPSTLDTVVKYCSWEPVVPIVVSFFVNMSVMSIAAESVYGTKNAANVGLTDFCTYFEHISGGCILWGIALLASGQSSAITTTYSGQFVMDGFLNLRMDVRFRAVMTRLVAILPCVFVSAFLPTYLNQLVNYVNSMLSILLPFALLPLIKYNCSPAIMGPYAATGWEYYLQNAIGIAIYLVNVLSLSLPGGGYFGELNKTFTGGKLVGIIIAQVIVQGVYFWWCAMALFKPIPNDGESVADIVARRGVEAEANNKAISEEGEKDVSEQPVVVAAAEDVVGEDDEASA